MPALEQMILKKKLAMKVKHSLEKESIIHLNGACRMNKKKREIKINKIK